MKRFEIDGIVASTKEMTLPINQFFIRQFKKGELFKVKDIDWCENKLILFGDANENYLVCMEDFVVYSPNFIKGDIITNHREIIIDCYQKRIPAGAVFEVVKNNSDGWLYVTRKNVGDNTKYTVKADRFIMCNPRAYMG